MKMLGAGLMAFGILLLLAVLAGGWMHAFGLFNPAHPEAFFIPNILFGMIGAGAGGIILGNSDSWPWWIERRRQERRIAQQEYLAALRERERVLQRAGLDFNP